MSVLSHTGDTPVIYTAQVMWCFVCYYLCTLTLVVLLPFSFTAFWVASFLLTTRSKTLTIRTDEWQQMWRRCLHRTFSDFVSTLHNKHNKRAPHCDLILTLKKKHVLTLEKPFDWWRPEPYKYIHEITRIKHTYTTDIRLHTYNEN